MQTLSPLRFGIAFGIAGAFFYIGCMIFMAIVPGETATSLSNSILHGVDVTSVMRESVPMMQSLVGILCTFVGGFIFGSVAASIYNFDLSKN